jgi:hypothetical protein
MNTQVGNRTLALRITIVAVLIAVSVSFALHQATPAHAAGGWFANDPTMPTSPTMPTGPTSPPSGGNGNCLDIIIAQLCLGNGSPNPPVTGGTQPKPCPSPPLLAPAGCIPASSGQNCSVGFSVGLLPCSSSSGPSSPYGSTQCPNGQIVYSPQPCPQGTQCANGQIVYSPQPCPQGTQCANGQTIYPPQQCPQGTQCQNGQIVYPPQQCPQVTPPQPCAGGNTRDATGNCPTGVTCRADNALHYPPNDPCPPMPQPQAGPAEPLPPCPGGNARDATGACPPSTPCPGGSTHYPPADPCPQGTPCGVGIAYQPDQCQPCPDGTTTAWPASACPQGTPCGIGTAYAPNSCQQCWNGTTAWPASLCPPGAPPTVNSVTCTPNTFVLAIPSSQEVKCTADVSADPSSPVTKWFWTDGSSDFGGTGTPANGFSQDYTTTFSMPSRSTDTIVSLEYDGARLTERQLLKPTQSTVTLQACTDSPTGIVSDASCGTGSATITINPPGGCRVDVRATSIANLPNYVVHHLFIIYVDQAGTETYFRGGPTEGNGSPITMDGGRYDLVRFGDHTVDWDLTASSLTVMSGDAACGKDACFTSEAQRIEGLAIAYSGATGPNSNTVARTLLHNCGVPEEAPGPVTPGWGSSYLAHHLPVREAAVRKLTLP